MQPLFFANIIITSSEIGPHVIPIVSDLLSIDDVFYKLCYIFAPQMDKKIKQYLEQIGSIFLLLLFMEYAGSSTLFLHNHTIDGRQVVHSHIYSGSPEEPNHSHTQQQAKLIAALSHIVIVAATTITFISVRRNLICCYLVCDKTFQNISIKGLNLLRAPPAFI